MGERGILRTIENGQLGFWCPGCKGMHVVTVEAGYGPTPWSFNGDYDLPTFTPSVLVRSGHYTHGDQPGNCWCDFSIRYPDKDKADFKCERCHSFVTDGHIQFLSDCTHELAGQTVKLTRPK